jgi:hypothetical protein
MVLLDESLLMKWQIICKLCHGSACEIIHNRLWFHKVCTRWVPEQLTMLQKQKCLHICQHLDRYGNERDTFFDRIITDDETWIHHYGPESNTVVQEEKFKSQPPKEN